MATYRLTRSLPLLAGAGGVLVSALMWLAPSIGEDDKTAVAPPAAGTNASAAPSPPSDAATSLRNASPAALSISETESPRMLQRAIERATSVDLAYEQRAARVSLSGLIDIQSIATPNGRSHAMAELMLHEQLANERLASAQREIDFLLAAAKSTRLDDGIRAHVLADLEGVLASSKQQHMKLHAAQLLAISTSRGLLTFMDENQANYDVQQGRAVFRSAGMAVQFDHYMTQINQLVGRELSLQQTTRVLREQLRALPIAADQRR